MGEIFRKGDKVLLKTEGNKRIEHLLTTTWYERYVGQVLTIDGVGTPDPMDDDEQPISLKGNDFIWSSHWLIRLGDHFDDEDFEL